jgi:hypothetical protein
MTSPGNEDGHYRGTMQPIDFIEANQLSFSCGSAIKYLARHRRKGKALDLDKAVWFLSRCVICPPPLGAGYDLLEEFCQSQDMDDDESVIMEQIMCWWATGSSSWLEDAIDGIRELREKCYE